MHCFYYIFYVEFCSEDTDCLYVTMFYVLGVSFEFLLLTLTLSCVEDSIIPSRTSRIICSLLAYANIWRVNYE